MEYALFRDDKLVMIGTYFEMVEFIHTNHCYSFDHALKYEGYKYVQTRDEEGKSTFDILLGL